MVYDSIEQKKNIFKDYPVFICRKREGNKGIIEGGLFIRNASKRFLIVEKGAAASTATASVW